MVGSGFSSTHGLIELDPFVKLLNPYTYNPNIRYAAQELSQDLEITVKMTAPETTGYFSLGSDYLHAFRFLFLTLVQSELEPPYQNALPYPTLLHRKYTLLNLTPWTQTQA